MLIFLSLMIAYLLGSINFSILISKTFKKIDIRQYGSGNAGATNTLRVLGKKWGIIVFVLDILKGVFALMIAQFAFATAEWVLFLTGLMAILGHNYPLFHQFRGGKGVATTIGVLVYLVPLATLIAAVLAILAIVIWRYVSVGSFVLVTVTTLLIPILYEESGIIAYITALIITVMTFYRHGQNLKNLFAGTERKIGIKEQIS